MARPRAGAVAHSFPDWNGHQGGTNSGWALSVLVAMANKMASIIRAILSRSLTYQPGLIAVI